MMADYLDRATNTAAATHPISQFLLNLLVICILERVTYDVLGCYLVDRLALKHDFPGRFLRHSFELCDNLAGYFKFLLFLFLASTKIFLMLEGGLTSELL